MKSQLLSIGVKVLWIGLALIAGLFLLLLSTPWLVWQYLHYKSKQQYLPATKAYHVNNAAMFYLNQQGYARHHQSPQQHAASVDQLFSSRYSAFLNIYQKIKYSNASLSIAEAQTIEAFYQPFIKQVKKGIPFKKRFLNFLNIYNTIHYFSKEKIS